jgi:hypothetical protein
VTRARRADAWLVAAAALLPLAAPSAAGAQLSISGEIDLLALNERDTRGLNRNFRLDSPYSQLRLRLFAQHWVTDRIGIFAELLYDVATDPRVYGAYVVVNELGGQGWLNARLGMAPPMVGNFALRDTYFMQNPLIGVPLLWQHRATIDGSGLARNEDLMRRRDQNVIGLPLLYTACWMMQWELLGQAGPFEYSLAATNGSLTNMAAMDENGIAYMARLGMEPVQGIRFGVSGFRGAYIGGPLRDPQTRATSYPGKPEDYLHRSAGYDVEVSYGKARFYSEGFAGDWEVPLIPEKLSAWSAYGELSYDVLPQWTPAVRVGKSAYSEISSTNDQLGPRTGWDDDVLQVESAVSYRLAREVLFRLGWQHTRFQTGPEEPIDLLAAQIKAVF